jgi:predicted transcriptional regulator
MEAIVKRELKEFPLWTLLLLVILTGMTHSQDFESQKGALALGFRPPKVSLAGAEGHFLDGRSWSSELIGLGKVTLIIYVGADHEKDNSHVEDSLRSHFPWKAMNLFAIVNTSASPIPDFLQRIVINRKQKRNPGVQFVLDQNRILEKAWHLPPSAYSILAFTRNGELFFSQSGPIPDTEVTGLVALIAKNLP